MFSNAAIRRLINGIVPPADAELPSSVVSTTSLLHKALEKGTIPPSLFVQCNGLIPLLTLAQLVARNDDLTPNLNHPRNTPNVLGAGDASLLALTTLCGYASDRFEAAIDGDWELAADDMGRPAYTLIGSTHNNHNDGKKGKRKRKSEKKRGPILYELPPLRSDNTSNVNDDDRDEKDWIHPLLLDLPRLVIPFLDPTINSLDQEYCDRLRWFVKVRYHSNDPRYGEKALTVVDIVKIENDDGEIRSGSSSPPMEILRHVISGCWQGPDGDRDGEIDLAYPFGYHLETWTYCTMVTLSLLCTKITKQDKRRVLLIGLGSTAAIPMFLKYYLPHIRVDVIENDRRLVMMAKDWCALNLCPYDFYSECHCQQPCVRVIMKDPLQFVASVDASLIGVYDSVMINVEENESIPSTYLTNTVFSPLLSLLNPDNATLILNCGDNTMNDSSVSSYVTNTLLSSSAWSTTIYTDDMHEFVLMIAPNTTSIAVSVAAWNQLVVTSSLQLPFRVASTKLKNSLYNITFDSSADVPSVTPTISSNSDRKVVSPNDDIWNVFNG